LLSLANYYLNNRIKENKTSGECGVLGEKRNACSIFGKGEKKQKYRDILEDLGIDGWKYQKGY